MKKNNIVWNGDKTPVSTHFNDVYFSNDDAIAETTYVYIDGNDLDHRFIRHTKPTFIIGETGFGSGLNFLIAWHRFLTFKQRYPNHILSELEFYSVEKFPLSYDELQKIHSIIIKDRQIIPLAKTLQNNWPLQRCQFDKVKLNLLLADITLFADHLNHSNILIDSWFFDGFAPSKNPDMWSKELFVSLYRQTAVNGTFATFTAAGNVRRNLITSGFHVNKKKGHGRKREMLIGNKS